MSKRLGLDICDVELDKAVLYKNRAAVNLKTKNYDAVIKVCYSFMATSVSNGLMIFNTANTGINDKVIFCYTGISGCIVNGKPGNITIFNIMLKNVTVHKFFLDITILR